MATPKWQLLLLTVLDPPSLPDECNVFTPNKTHSKLSEAWRSMPWSEAIVLNFPNTMTFTTVPCVVVISNHKVIFVITS